MPRPSEIAADARALYGPVATRPSAQEAGDGALWLDPEAGHALYQVQSGNWVQIGVGTAAPAAPTGVPVLYGPYVVDYTDIPTEAATMDLWTPQVGDVLLRLFVDWQTVTPFDSGTLFVGVNVDGTVAPAHNTLAYTSGGAGTVVNVAPLDNVVAPGYSTATDGSGNQMNSSAYVFHSTDPVQIQLAQTGGTDPGAGHVEIYALVARAVVP